MTPIVIALAGGTGSGKTSFAKLIAERVGEERTTLLSQDAYYRDPAHLPFEERAKINYDHPNAYETELLLEHLDALKRGESIPSLAYDYVRHARVTTEDSIEPKPIVLLEGILVLEDAALRDRFDIKLYIDTDADVRVLRRLERDIVQRGRSLQSVTEQYLTSVRPMHLEFIVPSKRHADLIIPEGAENRVALDIVLARIHELIRRDF